jgi:hypothetical protein
MDTIESETAYYFTAEVPSEIADDLRHVGVDVLCASELCNPDTEYPDILDRAQSLGRVVFTMDDGLRDFALSLQREARQFVGVLYAAPDFSPASRLITDLQASSWVPSAEFVNTVWNLPMWMVTNT